MSRKRKKSLLERAEKMRVAKASKKLGEQAPAQLDEDDLSAAGPSADNSVLLPGPTGLNSSDESSHEDTSDEDFEDTFTSEEADAVYQDWLMTMERDDLKIMAMMLHDNYVERFGLTKTAAASEVGLLLGFNEKTIRLWRKDFCEHRGEFTEYRRGKHARYVLLADEEYRDIALEWVRANAYSKGAPNLTALRFRCWVNESLLPIVQDHHPQVPAAISTRTARQWLHALGFQPSPAHKGVYFDGHEREDVVQYRSLFLRKLEILESTHAPPPPCSDMPSPVLDTSGRKKLVLLYHDESTFHSNDGQGWMWAEQGRQPIRPKGQGRGIMVSDFIEEYDGYLRLSDEMFERAQIVHPGLKQEARILLKYGASSEGYWNSEKFMSQVENAVKLADYKYPADEHNLVFLFDQSSGHTAYAEDALNVRCMNVNPGGSQPKMRDTTWNGTLQKMVAADGTPKGMRKVLEERGVSVAGMKAADMWKTLGEMRDFKYEKTKVETYIQAKGHRCLFLPKYHCELNPIERVWGHAKRHTRENCDYTFHGLERTISPALEAASTDLIRKYFRKARDYARAYREGHTAGPEVEKALKTYKSHRRVPETES